MTNEKRILKECRKNNGFKDTDIILCDYEACELFKTKHCDNWKHYVIDENINLFEDLFG